jgi:hypothetical protein
VGFEETARNAVKGTVKKAGKKAVRSGALKIAAWAAGASAPVLLPALAIALLMVVLMALLSSQGPENDPWAAPPQVTSCDTGPGNGAPAPTPVPGGGKPAGGLTAKQYQIEQIIVTEGLKHHIPDLGIISALSAGHQESGFHDWASKSDPPSLSAPMSDGPPATNGGYGDHGSLGVFQQQSSEPPMDNPYEPATANWGSWQQLMDPATAADLYYQALMQKGALQQSSNPGVIAQLVQVSATPLAYIQWTADSVAAFRQITGRAPDMSQTATPGKPVNITVGDGTTNGGSTGCATPQSGVGISAYGDPFRAVKNLDMTRIDQGVDATGSGSVYPVTDGVIVEHTASGWCGGCTSPDSYTVVKVTGGPAAGKYIYYAEACVLNPGLEVGSTVSVNTPMCVMNPAGIEFGWAQGPQNELPAASAWYHSHPNGSETNYGQNFNALLVALGNPTAHHQPGTPVEPMPAPGLPATWTRAGGNGGKTVPASAGCNSSAPGLIPQNVGQIVSYLRSSGYSKNATAGILGNMYRESHGDPESVGTGGGGLIGFTPLPPGYVTGNPAADMQTQLPAVLKFNQQWSQYLPMLNAASSPTQAADVYLRYFERAGVPAAPEREQSARDVATACGL